MAGVTALMAEAATDEMRKRDVRRRQRALQDSEGEGAGAPARAGPYLFHHR
jgi:hypothetical protein